MNPPPPLSLPARIALAGIGFYQRFISPGLPPSCRFYPSCSRYTYDAIARHGLGRGALLGAGRVCRCHPFHPGGVDLVPDELPTPRDALGLWAKKLKSRVRRAAKPRN